MQLLISDQWQSKLYLASFSYIHPLQTERQTTMTTTDDNRTSRPLRKFGQLKK